jgi:hypothetical protein
MAVAAIVKYVLLQHTTKAVTSTNVVLSRRNKKPARSARNFLVQDSFSSATTLFG